MEQKKKIFFGGEKFVFLKKLKKKFGKISGKIVGAVSEINSLLTNELTYKGEIIEPVAFAGSILLKNTVFWSSSRANNFFLKNGLHHFLGEPSGYLHAKFQKNLPSGYRELLGTNGRMDELTN